jgi:hypothetical protein
MSEAGNPGRAEGGAVSEPECKACRQLYNVRYPLTGPGDRDHVAHHELYRAEREKSERFRRALAGLLRDKVKLHEGDRITAIPVTESDLVEARRALEEGK